MDQSSERYILPSDESQFVGRIYDLSIVGMHFETYVEASKYPDVKYALDVNDRTTRLTRRVESLNHVGGLLWPDEAVSPTALPLSAYEYCNLVQDAFLMRIISVVDCCTLLLAEVLELNIPPREVKPSKIHKLHPGNPCVAVLDRLSGQQKELRTERNVRFHAGEEEDFTDDDVTFKIAALWAHRGSPLNGEDRYGRTIDIDRFFRDAVGRLRVKFNENSKMLVASLDDFYDPLSKEFEGRFKAKCREQGSFMRKSQQA